MVDRDHHAGDSDADDPTDGDQPDRALVHRRSGTRENRRPRRPTTEKSLRGKNRSVFRRRDFAGEGATRRSGHLGRSPNRSMARSPPAILAGDLDGGLLLPTGGGARRTRAPRAGNIRPARSCSRPSGMRAPDTAGAGIFRIGTRKMPGNFKPPPACGSRSETSIRGNAEHARARARNPSPARE